MQKDRYRKGAHTVKGLRNIKTTRFQGKLTVLMGSSR